MASMAKLLFGGPSKSASCCTSGTFGQNLHSPVQPRASNTKRRWSSDDQRQKVLRPETTRRSSLHTQQKAERALMREHFREKYKLPKNTTDQQQLKAAGGNIRLSRDLRAIVRHEEPYHQESSFVQLLSYKDLNTGASTVAESLQPKGRCLVM